MHTGNFSSQHASAACAIDGVHRFRNHRDPGKHAHAIGRGEHAIAQRQPLFTHARRFGAQHEMREIDIPRMRRDVRTLRHEAHVTQVTVVDDLPVDLAIDRVELAAWRSVDRIE